MTMTVGPVNIAEYEATSTGEYCASISGSEILRWKTGDWSIDDRFYYQKTFNVVRSADWFFLQIWKVLCCYGDEESASSKKAPFQLAKKLWRLPVLPYWGWSILFPGATTVCAFRSWIHYQFQKKKHFFFVWYSRTSSSSQVNGANTWSTKHYSIAYPSKKIPNRIMSIINVNRQGRVI